MDTRLSVAVNSLCLIKVDITIMHNSGCTESQLPGTLLLEETFSRHYLFYLPHIFFDLNFIVFIYFLYCRFLLVIYFIHISVYMSIPISQFIPPSLTPGFPRLGSKRLFSISVSLFLPCKQVYLYHFSRFHIYLPHLITEWISLLGLP